MNLFDRVRDGNGSFLHDLSPAKLLYDTGNTGYRASYAEDCIMENNVCNHLNLVALNLPYSACQIKDLFASFAYAHSAMAHRSVCPACHSLRCANTGKHRLTLRKSPRPISNARLKMLPLLHLHPINLVICQGTY